MGFIIIIALIVIICFCIFSTRQEKRQLAKATAGDAKAQFDCGCQCLSGNKLSDARKWLEKSLEQGILEAKFYLAICRAKEEGFKADAEGRKIFDACERLAEGGHADYQYVLGAIYEQGYIIDDDDRNRKHFIKGILEPDIIKACYWYKKSATQGDADGQAALAYCYLNGTGVEKNKEMALRLFCKSAENGNNAAKFQIGLLTGMSYEEFVIKHT